MSRRAQIEGGVVVNVAEVDPDNIPDWMEDWPEVTDAGPGWLWDGEAFTPPPEPPRAVPATVSAMQARIALANAGLLATVETAVLGATQQTQIAWEYATEWQRTSPTIAELAGIIGLTEAQVDDLFRAAAEIEV